MQTITIKPHHFMDMIKLYGAGIDIFVPDEKMKHDFYKIANDILLYRHITLKLTTHSDDICQPCLMNQGNCIDTIHHIPDFHFKEAYNQMLDKRIISLFELNIHRVYYADELCFIMLKKHEYIYQVWIEEENTITEKRHQFFILGAKKFLT